MVPTSGTTAPLANHYSDFNCTDSNGDGICDSVYRIFGGESVDRYPLAKPPT
jgi:nitrous oxidase accessory protein NosD